MAKEMLSFCDKYYLIGSKILKNNEEHIDVSKTLEISGQFLSYNHLHPKALDHIGRNQLQAYNQTIKEHEVKPGIYTLHPTLSHKKCPKDQMQFIFLAMLLNKDSDRAFITLIRIINRLGAWQDWRLNPLKALMLPSDLSILVRTLLQSNKKYLILYPFLIVADLFISLSTIKALLTRQSRTKTLRLHALLAASRYTPTPLTYLNLWLYTKFKDPKKQIDSIYSPPNMPPIHEISERFHKKHFSLTKAQNILAKLTGLVIIAIFAASIYFVYTKINMPKLKEMRIKSLLCKE